MRPIGIEHISVFGLPPPDFVRLAAELGCQHISTGVQPIPYNPQDYPVWSLLDDLPLRRETARALAETGVTISLGGGVAVAHKVDIRERAPVIDALCGLGARMFNALSFDRDRVRSIDQIGVLADMLAERGAAAALEFAPGSTFPDLVSARDAVRQIGRGNLGLMIDTMHFARSGSSLADLEALAPGEIVYVQLCDAPRTDRFDTYLEEAMYERMAPGAGELPLKEILARTPRDVVVGLEVPLRGQAEAGVGPRERLQPCVDAARALLAEVDA
jgi:sugar phosphate isomerase/epimerase